MRTEGYCDIAIVFNDLVEFYAMKNGVDALTKEGIDIDIIVAKRDTPAKQRLDETYETIVRQGYSPLRSMSASIKYKILLEPYPLRSIPYNEVNYEFRIKYKYSLATAKPDPVHSIDWNIMYDAILCYSIKEKEKLSAYTKTYQIAPLKFKGFTRNNVEPKDKPVLLYLPTFGEVSSIDHIGRAISKLKDKYYIIAKAHHRTQYAENEKHRVEALKNYFDEYYDQETDLLELLKRADVVLSDNSAAIFDAIYAEVPVAVYNPGNLNARKLGKIDTYQYQLVKRGVVPYTDDIDKIGDILNSAGDYREKQRTEKTNFLSNEDATGSFVEVIKSFLAKERDGDDYYALHDMIKNDRLQSSKRIKDLENEISSIRNSRAYKLGNKLAAPYRTIVNRIKSK